MVHRIGNFVLIALVVALLMLVTSSSSSPIQDDSLEELRAELKSLRVKMNLLEARNVANEAKIAKLEGKIEMKPIERAEETSLDGETMKIISLENLLNEPNDSIKKSSVNSDDSSTRAIAAPSSCRDLSILGHSLDGLYLVQNVDTNKIESVLCNFGTSISQQFIGNVDVKAKTVHFYVQRNTTFSTFGIIPWEVERLNEGGAMNLASGIFTVPMDGIYHFQFSGMKPFNTEFFYVFLQVNGNFIGGAGTSNDVNTGTYESYSLTASLKLKTGDRVGLRNVAGSEVYDNDNFKTHFTGWLVEEDLPPGVRNNND